MRLTALISALFIAAAPAVALDFEDAVQLWLNGNDADALPALAMLAADGDSRARVLLARIEITDRGPSSFRLGLSRKDARMLFRNGTTRNAIPPSWLRTEAEAGNRLATLLYLSRQPRPNPDLIRELHTSGEAQASDYPTRILALYGTQEQREALLSDGPLLDELQPYLRYLTETAEPRGDGIAALRHIAGPGVTVDPADEPTLGMAGILALGYPYGDISAENPWRTTVENWLLSDPAASPIAATCNEACPATADACAFAMMALTGGYFEVIRLDSPVETYIPQEDFLVSPRARIMALRRAALTRAETDEVLATYDEIAEIDQCTAELITMERLK